MGAAVTTVAVGAATPETDAASNIAATASFARRFGGRLAMLDKTTVPCWQFGVRVSSAGPPGKTLLPVAAACPVGQHSTTEQSRVGSNNAQKVVVAGAGVVDRLSPWSRARTLAEAEVVVDRQPTN